MQRESRAKDSERCARLREHHRSVVVRLEAGDDADDKQLPRPQHKLPVGRMLRVAAHQVLQPRQQPLLRERRVPPPKAALPPLQRAHVADQLEHVRKLEHSNRDANVKRVVRVAVRTEEHGAQRDAEDGGQLQRIDDDEPVLVLVDERGCCMLGCGDTTSC